jgi:hypothetical protein
MSNELTVATERGQSLAELMGVSAPVAKSGPSIARIAVVSTPIKGEIEVGGKKIKTDVVPVGALKITLGDDVYYTEEADIRVFLQRQQWQRWNSGTNMMEKTVMANSLNGDLMDNLGGFNLGRPSGYIEDFNALPQKTKDIMRSVKQVKVYMGMLSASKLQDSEGKEIDTTLVDVAFVMDVRNRQSNKSLKDALDALGRKNILPIMSTIKLSGAEDSIPTGAVYGYMTASVGDKVELTEEDNEILKNFLDYVEYMNGKIIDDYHAKSDDSLSDEDAALVGSIVDVDDEDDAA